LILLFHSLKKALGMGALSWGLVGLVSIGGEQGFHRLGINVMGNCYSCCISDNFDILS